MNPRTKSVPGAALYPVPANAGETAITGFPGDLQDVFTVGIGEVLELERASVSCAIEVYKSGFGLPLFAAPFLETITTSLQSCLELQRNWLDLLAPRSGSTAARAPVIQDQDPPEAEEEAAEEEYAEDFVVETFENY